MQETWDQSLTQEDPTCHGPTKAMHPPQLLIPCAKAWEPQLLAHMPQLPKPVHPRARDPQQEKPPSMRSPCNATQEQALLAETREEPVQQQRPSTARSK